MATKATPTRPGSSRRAPAKKAAAARKTSTAAPEAKRQGVPLRGADPSKWWRPKDPVRRPVCGYELDGKRCRKSGPHYCEPRADKAVRFHLEVLVHTKGQWARQRFEPEGWQEWDIVRPLFGEVVWSEQWQRYVRRYSIVFICIARKNGKSEMLAGFVLVLLVGDDEHGAEVYGAAKDKDQADKVGMVVEEIRKLQPILNGDAIQGGGRRRGRLQRNKSTGRIWDEKTSSFFDRITADALGELGHNPHGWYIDEVLSQPDASLFDALRTAEGTRHQALGMLATTETNDPSGFGADQIDEAERIMQDPARAPHVLAYVRKLPRTKDELRQIRETYRGHPDLPVSLDPFDERNWRWPNPAIDSFKARQKMREMSIEARNDPAKENSFRQFQCNQRVSQVSRWMSMPKWDQSSKITAFTPDDLAELEEGLKGRTCFGGLDLASTIDLAAWTLFFPPTSDEPAHVLWRFFTPEAMVPTLDKHLGGKASVWVDDGLLVATEGDWIDYEGEIHPRIEADRDTFRIKVVGYDQKEATATAQFMQGLGMTVKPVVQGFGLSAALKEIKHLVLRRWLEHGAHPVAWWNLDSAEVRQNGEEQEKLEKPVRAKSGKRIDGLASLANGVKVWLEDVDEPPTPPPATAKSTPPSGDSIFRPKRRLRL